MILEYDTDELYPDYTFWPEKGTEWVEGKIEVPDELWADYLVKHDAYFAVEKQLIDATKEQER